jgi:uncharacterized protein (TIGR02117 family)
MWSGPPPRPASAAHADRIVYVLRRGYHTDIGVRTADLAGPIATIGTRYPTAQTLLFGFGDRTFVTTRRKWIGDWLLALLPGRGAMLVTGLRTTPQEAFGTANVVQLGLTDPQFSRVEDYVNRSFVLAANAPVWIANGPYRGSLFYASTRTYDLLDTCNTWTAAALRHAGLDVPVAFTLFSGQAFRSARHLRQG